MEEKMERTQNPYLVPGAIIIAGIIIAGAVFFTQSPALQTSPSSQQPRTESPLPTGQEPSSGEVSVDFEGWPSLGNPEAPVVMVEYSDFACPWCTRFWQETLPLIKRDYIDKGKVLFVYKDSISVGGDRAAEAAHCAAEQGKYWEYHDLLFSRHSQDRQLWPNSSVHRGYAEQLGLDADALVECFGSRRYQEKVVLSSGEAIQNGGGGTPYFLINEQPVFGAKPYSDFQQVIDSLLAGN